MNSRSAMLTRFRVARGRRGGAGPRPLPGRLEAGRPADPERLLAAHPAIAEQLRACLKVMHLADRMAGRLRVRAGHPLAARPGATTLPLGTERCCRPGISRAVRLRTSTCASCRTMSRLRSSSRPIGDAGDARGERGPVPASGRDRPRRHGGDPQGPRRRPGPRPGDQGAAGIAPGQSRGRAPVRRRGADRRPVAAPGDRAGVRAGDVRRPPAVLRHEAGQGADPGGAAARAHRARRTTCPGSWRSSSRSARRWPTPTPGA